MTTATMTRSFALPSTRTVINLALGGFAGLGFWELFSAVPTAWFAEYPLEPPELVKSLFYHQLGLTISTPTAKPSSAPNSISPENSHSPPASIAATPGTRC